MSDFKRNVLLLATAALAMIAVPACGGPEDPSENNGSENNSTENNSTENNSTENNSTENNSTENNTSTNNTSTNNTSTNNTSANNTSTNNTSTNNTSTNNTSTNNTSTNNTSANNSGEPDCDFISMYTGQVGSERGGGGGVFTVGTGSYDGTGLQGVVDKIKAELDAGNIVADEDTSDDEDTELLELAEGDYLEVTGAVVVATKFDKEDEDNNFIGATFTYLQDADTGLVAVMDPVTTDINGDPITLRVGTKINFKVTTIKAYGGDVPQIAGITDVEVVGEGVDVGVIEATGADVTVADHFGKLVRVHGVVKSETGACGGSSICYEFEHGEAGSEKTITLRSASEFVEVGDCATFVGPVNSFPGPLTEGADAQLDTGNYDWYRGPFKGE